MSTREHAGLRSKRVAGAILIAAALSLVATLLLSQRSPPATATGLTIDIVKHPSSVNLFLGGDDVLIEERVANLSSDSPLGEFQLHVEYDPNVIGVEIAEGPFLGSTGRATSCTTTAGPGLLLFSCTSTGAAPGPTGSGVLAILTVSPQWPFPLRAANNNGVLTYVNDISGDTWLYDTEGNGLPIRTVGDAKVVLRVLEGDVNKDCVVDVVDRQLLFVRLGATEGSSLYSPLYDLEPDIAPDGIINVNDLQFVDGRKGSTCANPQGGQGPPTPQPTLTQKPTATPTPTPTPQPSVHKAPPLQNLFLTRQGAKIPPANCLDGTDVAELTQTLVPKIGGTDKHGDPRSLGGFSFTTKYDQTRVCVEIVPGAETANQGMQCVVQDARTAPALQGVATVYCVTAGKNVSAPLPDPANRVLATLLVRPMPEVYSLMKANNGNGLVTQLLNSSCKLTDRQGDPIKQAATTCTDAAVTMRYLEADVEPDCKVDGLDTQLVAFRWGAVKGTLLFSDRFNVEPSPPLLDNDIDVNDLQFAYGRLGSTCEHPHELATPINPWA